MGLDLTTADVAALDQRTEGWVDGLQLAHTLDTPLELLRNVERHQPDLALIDVRMPPTNTDDGLRAALQIRARWPKIGILVLSQYVEAAYAVTHEGARHLEDVLTRRTRIYVETADRGTAAAPRVAERIIRTFTRPFEIDGHPLSIGASIGLALKGALDPQRGLFGRGGTRHGHSGWSQLATLVVGAPDLPPDLCRRFPAA